MNDALLEETVATIAVALDRPSAEIAQELHTWIRATVFPYGEMLPIARRNVLSGLPMTRLPAFKRVEIATGTKYVPGGGGLTWQDIMPFEW